MYKEKNLNLVMGGQKVRIKYKADSEPNPKGIIGGKVVELEAFIPLRGTGEKKVAEYRNGGWVKKADDFAVQAAITMVVRAANQSNNK